MRVWIDLSNSPHPLFFAPIARRLENRGHEIHVTLRANAQTRELARARWPGAEEIGGESPGGRVAKGYGILARVRGLRRWAREHRPDLALSHNSYAQIVAARSQGMPIVTSMDFEHQPANHLAFRLAGTVLVPDAFPERAARRQGAGPRRLVRYPGLKESVYLGDAEPDPGVLEELGVPGTRRERLVVARTPPSRAVYHQRRNPLFEDCLRALDESGATTIVLPRHDEQVEAVGQLGLARCVVARSAVDSRSLLRVAGLFIGAGGTMTREAALLGVPAVTVFAGRVPAVDRRLEQRGLITRIRDPRELPEPTASPRSRTMEELAREAEPILDRFVAAVESARARRAAR